jgi:MFS family permease
VRTAAQLLRLEPQTRPFFAAHLQSSLGTGAAYVGLLLLAYERFHSPWAISLVLLADLLPAVVLGPLLGAAVDRWSRRACAVGADLVRAGAFAGLALVDSFAATVAFAALAGAGTGLFRPAVLAALPSLVSPARLAAATSLYSAIASADILLGPALGALVLLVAEPEALMAGNAATFLVSAAILVRLPFGRRAVRGDGEAPASLLAEARAGMRAVVRMRGVRAVIGASASVLLFAGLFNVAELPFARDELGAGDAQFSLLVGAFGLGIAAGSLAVGGERDQVELRRRFLLGLLLVGLGFAGSAAAPAYGVALGTFLVAGIGNGLVVVHERLLIQLSVPDALMGRVFAAGDALGYGLFTAAFLGAGALLTVMGTRPLLAISALGTLVVWAVAARALAQLRPGAPPVPAAPGALNEPSSHGEGEGLSSSSGASRRRARSRA